MSWFSCVVCTRQSSWLHLDQSLCRDNLTVSPKQPVSCFHNFAISADSNIAALSFSFCSTLILPFNSLIYIFAYLGYPTALFPYEMKTNNNKEFIHLCTLNFDTSNVSYPPKLVINISLSY